MSRLLLHAQDLSVARGGREVVHHVSCELVAGEVVALLGPNGAGKSTLLEALAGGLEPTGGSVRRSGRVAVALQSGDLANRSVLANVTLALSWWGVPGPQRRPRALEALEAMQAGHLAGRRALTLSGGERRRVHLARALAVKPDLLLLDEPFAGLDGETRAALLSDTGAVLRNVAGGALVVVHDRAEAWALADRLLILLDGRIAAQGSPRALLQTPPTAAVARFLGFDGELANPDGSSLLTRPQHVCLDPDSPVRARVSRLIPVEDGVRLELTLPHGRLHLLAALPSPLPGEEVGVRVTGGARFPPGDGQPGTTVATASGLAAQ